MPVGVLSSEDPDAAVPLPAALDEVGGETEAVVPSRPSELLDSDDIEEWLVEDEWWEDDLEEELNEDEERVDVTSVLCPDFVLLSDEDNEELDQAAPETGSVLVLLDATVVSKIPMRSNG